MRSLAANDLLGLFTTIPLIGLLILHELLGIVGHDSGRFTLTRRRVSIVIWILITLLAILIATRFYYLRR